METPDSADISAHFRMAKKLTKDPDKYLAHKFKDESINTSTLVPLDYRPAPHTYTVRFKREIMKALVEVGSLPKFAHAVKVTCDERKQKFPKSRRALKLDDVKFIRQNPHSRATRADVAELDGMSALNAPNSNQTTAVAAEGNFAVADDENTAGTAQPLHTANTFTPSLPAPLANVGRKMRKVTRSQKKESSGDAKVNADHVFAACDRATAYLAEVRRTIERDDTETSSMLLYAHRVVAGLTDSLDEFEKAGQDELARIRENIARVQDKIARIG